MIPRARRLLASVGVLAFATGLTVWLAVNGELVRPQSPEMAATAAATASGSRVLAPLSAFAAIADRPLFAPTRRPLPQSLPAAPIVETKPPPVTTPTLSAALAGVLISPDGRFAVLRWPDGKNTTLAEGAAVDGWLLKQVTPDRAVFISGSTSAEVTFPAAQVLRTAAAAAATGRPAIPVRRRQ
jgi:general secretion pathway protein N